MFMACVVISDLVNKGFMLREYTNYISKLIISHDSILWLCNNFITFMIKLLFVWLKYLCESYPTHGLSPRG
jgi:hypothetical protein